MKKKAESQGNIGRGWGGVSGEERRRREEEEGKMSKLIISLKKSQANASFANLKGEAERRNGNQLPPPHPKGKKKGTSIPPI